MTLDVWQIGAIAENVTVTGQPAHRHVERIDGRQSEPRTLESLPAPGRNAFLIGVTVPTVMPVGDRSSTGNGSDQRVALSLGNGGIRASNYVLDGVPISELRGRAVLNPTIEAVGGQVRSTPTTPRWAGPAGVFNVTARSGFAITAAALPDAAGLGDRKTSSAVAGVTKEESGLADAYRLCGGGIGGPIIKNRTFFWTATEGYRSGTTRGQQEIWPTANQRNGDFSHSAGGVPVVLFNPYCRSGRQRALSCRRCPARLRRTAVHVGIIPLTHQAVSQTGLNILKTWPTETINGPMQQTRTATPTQRHGVCRRQALMWTFRPSTNSTTSRR